MVKASIEGGASHVDISGEPQVCGHKLELHAVIVSVTERLIVITVWYDSTSVLYILLFFS